LAFWWALTIPSEERSEAVPARWWPFVAAGGLFGLTLYTYQPARLIPLLFVGFAFYLYGVHRPFFRANRAGLLLFGLAAVGVAMPLFLFLSSQPSGEAERAWTVEPLTELLAGNLGPVWTNTLATAQMFSLAGDPLMAQNIPGRPVFVPAWTGLFFYAGLALALVRWRRPVYAFILLWLGTALLPTILTVSAPHFNRTIAAQTPVMLLAALPIVEAAAVAGRWRRWASVIPVVIGLVALGVTGFVTWGDYFGRWAVDPGVAFQYSASITAVARYLDEAGGDRPAVISSLGFENTDPYIVSAILDKDDEMRRWLHAGEAIGIPANSQQALLILGFDQWLNPALATFFDVPAEARLTSRYFTVYELEAPSWPNGTELPAYSLAAGLPWPAPEENAVPLSLPVSFQERVSLQSIQLLTPEIRPGSPLALLTTWQVEQKGEPASLALFVHLLNAAGQLVGQQDGLGYPPHTWRAGDQFANVHSLQLDSGLPAGSYWVQMGLYRRDTGERWLMVDGEKRPLGDRLLLGPLEVAP
jgi:hypothetical protein